MRSESNRQSSRNRILKPAASTSPFQRAVSMLKVHAQHLYAPIRHLGGACGTGRHLSGSPPLPTGALAAFARVRADPAPVCFVSVMRSAVPRPLTLSAEVRLDEGKTSVFQQRTVARNPTGPLPSAPAPPCQESGKEAG